jgi:hypothetical protein
MNIQLAGSFSPSVTPAGTVQTFSTLAGADETFPMPAGAVETFPTPATMVETFSTVAGVPCTSALSDFRNTYKIQSCNRFLATDSQLTPTSLPSQSTCTHLPSWLATPASAHSWHIKHGPAQNAVSVTVTVFQVHPVSG